jgi:telomerase Cajal body protein 1
MVVCGSYARAVGVFDRRAGGAEAMEMIIRHAAGITAVAVSADGRTIVAGARRSDVVHVWDVRSPGAFWRRMRPAAPCLMSANAGTPVISLERPCSTNQRIALELVANDTVVVTGGTDGAVRYFSLTGLHASPLMGGFQAHSTSCNGVSVHPYLPVVATAGGQRWCVEMCGCILVASLSDLPRASIRMSGSRAADSCASTDARIRLWRMGT